MNEYLDQIELQAVNLMGKFREILLLAIQPTPGMDLTRRPYKIVHGMLHEVRPFLVLLARCRRSRLLNSKNVLCLRHRFPSDNNFCVGPGWIKTYQT